ncbi:carbon monoxide dehydrogenase subunit G [Flavobacterium sp. HSC-61S13]|nr:BamA/TamA family outer membrane protein [Flavobacterium sp. HSC-61S13]MCP1996902.1 carbon monoxide dehydrogenase subunit G [Flavobacterium sp. HSC-61S13]
MQNEIFENGKKNSTEAVHNQLYQQPNSSILGYRLRLHLYNLAKPNADSSYQAWLDKHPTTHRNLTAFLSEKQVGRLGKSFAVSGFSQFLKNTGEPPVLYEENRMNRSVIRLKNYYFNQGFFNTTVQTQVDSIGDQKTKVTYQIETGKVYVIDSVSTRIFTPALDSLYKKNASKALVVPEKVYNSKDFEAERKRITTSFRNNGAYYFQESNIHYDVDTINNNHKANIELIIDDRTVKSGDTLVQVPFKIYKISDVNIFTDNTSKKVENIADSINFNNFNIYSANKLEYRPKALTDAIFITKGSTFSDFRRVLTSRSISNLRIFNYPSIEYIEDQRDSTGQSLVANIFLTPRKKMTFNPSLDVTHSNIQDFGIAGNMGLIIRNVFRGAEILDIGLRGSVGSSRDMANPNNVFLNVSEYGIDTKLSFPRLVFPIKTESIIPKSMLPRTMMSFGLFRQQNIGLDKENFTGIVNYSWSPKRNTSYSLDLLNLQYVRNTNPSNYFIVYKSSYNTLNDIAQRYEKDGDYFDSKGDLAIQDGRANTFINDVLAGQTSVLPGTSDYQNVRSIEERRLRLSENNLILAANISFTKSSKTDIKDNNFYTFKAKFESAGGLVSLLTKSNKSNVNENGNHTLLNVEFSQYVKTEIDFIKYWDLGRQQVLAFHTFGGIAIPYGNSNSIPFSRSYFAGGSNDNRAWHSYRLGPGSSGAINDFNEANMKLFASAEYRFNITGKWNGALFLDAGNIWNIFDHVEDEAYTFNGVKSLGDLALGSGFGLRYDFSFFVFRFDLGFKTYNPSKPEGEKWFKELNFGKVVVNVGINYPF